MDRAETNDHMFRRVLSVNGAVKELSPLLLQEGHEVARHDYDYVDMGFQIPSNSFNNASKKPKRFNSLKLTSKSKEKQLIGRKRVRGHSEQGRTSLVKPLRKQKLSDSKSRSNFGKHF
jgi:hypothetical protein